MRHTPVLLNEVIEMLQPKPGMNVVDATLGDAGHAEALLLAISPNGRLLGIDADQEAVDRARGFLAKFDDRAILVQGNFSHIASLVAENNFGPIHAMLFDLGWSRPQFEDRGRGFSFTRGDEPLDMRYDPTGPVTAASLLQSASEASLEKIIRTYGEEPMSREIAHTIVESRRHTPIERVAQLVSMIVEIYKTKLQSKREIPWIGGLHPATRTFQALRIAVNRELEILETAVRDAVTLLAPGGRCAIISFHSLEDRIVKHTFKELPDVRILTKRPITCQKEEQERNPSARSARLRAIEK